MEAMSKLYLSKKAMIKILVSLVSVFSFVIVFYSSTVVFHLLSTLSMQQLFSYSPERNYIFLLCNGILVFIIRNSGFTANSSLLTDHDFNYKYQLTEKTTEIHIHVTPDDQSSQIVKPAILFIQEEEEEEETDTIQNGILVTTRDANNANSNPHDHENEVEQPLMQLIDIPEYDGNNEHEFEEEEEGEKEGTEELNMRCEEFIRRMKEDIKTEARATQLIMIN